MHTTEYVVMQNACLGAACLWSFVHEYWTQKKRREGPFLGVVSCVLPLALHRESAGALHGRRFKGGLLNALADDRSLTVGLQDRMESMSDQTFESLRMAFAAELLELRSNDFTLVPLRKTLPPFEKAGVINEMLATASRLGYWFATLPFDQVCNYLRIRL